MSASLLCTKEAIKASLDSCQYVQMACENQYDYLNFLSFYYCDINQNVPLIVVLSILFVLFTFNLLGTTADRFLAPSLETIAQKFKLSEAIAGVTLLAFANGATDVIAGIVAGGKETGGVQIAIGALFGACLFTVTCVLARCIQGAGTIRLNSSTLKRDIAFLLIATGYFIFLCLIDMITPVLAAGFFVIYVLYFCYILYMDKRKSAPKKILTEKLLHLEIEQHHHHHHEHRHIQDPTSHDAEQEREDKDFPHQAALMVGNPYNNVTLEVAKKLEESSNKSDETLSNTGGDQEIEEPESAFDRAVDKFNIPFLFIRSLTMPPFDEEKWNPYIAMVTPFLGTLFVIWQIGYLNIFVRSWYCWTVYLALTVPLSLWILTRGRQENLAAKHSTKFAIPTFIISILWLNLLASCFMDFLSLMTVISGMPLNYLSLTMLAWGNSLDDFFIDYFIAKSGHGVMAVTGVYAGQLFNLLLGFGGSMFRQSLNGTVRPNIFSSSGDNTNVLTLILLASLVLCLVWTLILGKLQEWNISKRMIVFLLGFYLTFFVSVTIISLM